MATIRVFLLTYRRPVLLRRALQSLLAQTFTDWICELHNDAPDDDTPRAVLAELAAGDGRIHYHAHEKNWGAIASFNHAFGGGPEPFASVLEDDNWWEPAFLAETLAALETHPAADLAWANMKVWREEPDGAWSDTGRTIWPFAIAAQPRIFRWPELLQAFDALHSNGAMLFRARIYGRSTVPQRTPFAMIEPARERTLSGELLLLPRPLANFAVTQTSARGNDRVVWAQSQLLLAGSFFSHVPLAPAALASLWAQHRAMRPRSNLLFLLVLAGCVPRNWLRHASARDWVWFVLNFLRHPSANLRALRFRATWPAVWAFLNQSASERTAEARARGFTAIGDDALLSKHPAP